MDGKTKQTQRRAATGQGATRARNSSPAAIARRERDLKVVELRKAGLSWQAIADLLAMSGPGQAYKRFMVVMDRYPREDVETWRNIISDRYDAVLRGIWPKVLAGDVRSVEQATRILESQARLHGANRPQKIEVSAGASELDAALRELEAEMTARAGGAPVPRE